MFPFNHIPINLPPVVLLHAVGLTLYGARLIIKSSIQFTTTTTTDKSKSITPTRVTTDNGTKGLLMFGIGLLYLITGSYLPEAQNAYLYATTPVRILLASIASLRLHFVKGLSSEAKMDMWMLVLGDGVMGVVTGLQLGRFDGRMPGW